MSTSASTPPINVQFSIENLNQVKEAFESLTTTTKTTSFQTVEQLEHTTKNLRVLITAMSVFNRLRPLMIDFIDKMKELSEAKSELGIFGSFLTSLTKALGPTLLELIKWAWLLIPVIYQIVRLLQIQAVQNLLNQIAEYGPFALITVAISIGLALIYIAWIESKVPWGPSGAAMLSAFIPKLPQPHYPTITLPAIKDMIHIDTHGKDNEKIQWFAGKLVTRLKTEGIVSKNVTIIYR